MTATAAVASTAAQTLVALTLLALIRVTRSRTTRMDSSGGATRGGGVIGHDRHEVPLPDCATWTPVMGRNRQIAPPPPARPSGHGVLATAVEAVLD